MCEQRIGDVAEVMLGYVEANKTFQTEKILSVPARSYTDPAQLRAETELVFKKVPLMLALSCEMPKPGDYKALEAVGLPILIIRDKVGAVRAFFNVCAHRWSPLVPQGCGNRSRFTCPFHGWTYGADGKLIGVADSAKFGEIDRSTQGLRELPCEERYGMIFVCLTPGTTLDLAAYYGSLLDEYADVDLKNWAFLGSRVLEGANWKITLNNFLETYHFAMLHPKTVATVFEANVTHYEGFGSNMRIGLAQRSIRNLREVPRVQWGQQEGQGFVFIRIFFPNVTGYLAPEGELSLFTQTFPGLTPDRSRTVLLFARRRAPQDAADLETIEEQIKYLTFEVTQDEDVAIGAQIQRGLESGAHDGLLYGRNEGGNQYFQEWLNWYLQGDPTLPKPTM